MLIGFLKVRDADQPTIIPGPAVIGTGEESAIQASWDQGCRRGHKCVRKTGLGPAAESNFLDLAARRDLLKL